MNSKIIEREEINLNEQQAKMVMRGWGKESFENTVTEKVTYLSDGLKVKGYIAYPKDNAGKKFPCIIWNRGGYRDNGAIDKFTARGMYGLMAGWGYTVFAPQYRGNAGGEGEEELGGGDVNDIINIMPLADEFEFADTSRWGIEGWSRGGMMTFLTLMQKPEFKCAVLSGAITNIKQYAAEKESRTLFYKGLMGEDNFEEKITRRSIINRVEELPDIPYLLMHGGGDKTVSPLQTIEIAKKLTKRGISHRLVILEEGDHFLKNHRQEVDRLRRYWYDKYLK